MMTAERRGTGPGVHAPDVCLHNAALLTACGSRLAPHKRKEWTTAELQKGWCRSTPGMDSVGDVACGAGCASRPGLAAIHHTAHRQLRERLQGAGDVEEAGVGLDVHGEVKAGVAHGGPGGARGNAVLAQVYAEGVARPSPQTRPLKGSRMAI